MFLDLPGAELEDVSEFALHYQWVCEVGEGYVIVDGVVHQYTVLSLYKTMIMSSSVVWDDDLLINESTRWLLGTFADLPPNRDGVESQTVVDQCSLFEPNWSGSYDLEVQPRRCDNLQLERIREEVEDIIELTLQNERYCQLVSLALGVTTNVTGEFWSRHDVTVDIAHFRCQSPQFRFQT